MLAKLRLEQVEIAMNPDVFPPSKFHLPEVQVVKEMLHRFTQMVLIRKYSLLLLTNRFHLV